MAEKEVPYWQRMAKRLPAGDYLLAPTRYTLRQAGQLGSGLLRNIGIITSEEKVEDMRNRQPVSEMTVMTGSLERALRLGDVELLEVTIKGTENALDLGRRTLLRISAQETAKRHIHDAEGNKRRVPAMNEDRILGFKTLMTEHLKAGETLADLGIDEIYEPTLRTYYPELWPPAESEQH